MKNFFIVLAALSININAQAQLFLEINAVAQPDNTCAGQSVQLSAVVTGNPENYTYSWSSVPIGFSSTVSNPTAAPQVTTLYSVNISDGINTETQSVTVTVKPKPVINLIPAHSSDFEISGPGEISLCPYKSITLDAGNPGCSYLWNDGTTNQTIVAQTSGISFDYKYYEVTVTDPVSGCSNTSSLSVNFDYSACSYGLEEKAAGSTLKLFPNPSSDGIFSFHAEKLSENLILEVYSSTGILVKSVILNPSNSAQVNSKVDLQDQPSGLYFVKVTGKSVKEMHKILIQR